MRGTLMSIAGVATIVVAGVAGTTAAGVGSAAAQTAGTSVPLVRPSGQTIGSVTINAGYASATVTIQGGTPYTTYTANNCGPGQIGGVDIICQPLTSGYTTSTTYPYGYNPYGYYPYGFSPFGYNPFCVSVFLGCSSVSPLYPYYGTSYGAAGITITTDANGNGTATIPLSGQPVTMVLTLTSVSNPGDTASATLP